MCFSQKKTLILEPQRWAYFNTGNETIKNNKIDHQSGKCFSG